ncbi:MAG: N-6 DNA methylase [Bacteroidetes bacterium]|nr:N-6 DNA methylase [Bacteroidota bacterium]
MKDIEAIERRLWASADTLRTNSNYASNEYMMPVLGLIFLRHAFSRFLLVKGRLEANLPQRGGKARALRKEDFSGQGSIYLRPEAQFDHLVDLTDGDDRAAALEHAMESIEKDYDMLKGVLPKSEYKELDNAVLGSLLRTFNDEALKKATGDVFGRIYEYFLTGFADQKAHDGGEFFTPVSLVQMIVSVIEPDHGTVLDPACGSGGMFVQSAHFIEKLQQNPRERATFFGLEKNATTIRLGKMNLAVHGLEGKIQKAITYYDDPHELLGKADYVMANPPFNTDEVDADKVKNDPRLPFGLPGVNKKKKVSNGNYLWISYFYSYLNARGRAGFVMSSQASSAGRDEATVRRKLVETGAVDVMMAIRSNFFYTRTVPCELWFLDKAKCALTPGPSPKERGASRRGRDTVLMLDARNVYTKVTRKIFDFSPGQQANLSAIVWLYRGQRQRFLDLVAQHLRDTLRAAEQCLAKTNDEGALWHPIANVQQQGEGTLARMEPFLKQHKDHETLKPVIAELREALKHYAAHNASFRSTLTKLQTKELIAAPKGSDKLATTNAALHQAAQEVGALAELGHTLAKEADRLHKLLAKAHELCEKELNARDAKHWPAQDLRRDLKVLAELRPLAVDQLKQVRYHHRYALWLQERFPDAELRDVEGLVKLVDRQEIEANDWSLTPGRYVGIALDDEDEQDFDEVMTGIKEDLVELNNRASELGLQIIDRLEFATA